MPAHLGVNDLDGLVAPEGGYAHERTTEDTRRIVPLQDDQGTTIKLDPFPFQESQVSIRGIGSPDLTLAAASTASPGDIQILEVVADQKVGEREGFEIKARKYTNDA